MAPVPRQVRRPTCSALARRSLKCDPPLEQEKLESACYYVKQVAGLGCGVAFGMAETDPYQGFIIWVIANLILTYYMYARVFQVDIELLEPQGQIALIQVGFMPSLGSLVLVWTLLHTLRL